MNEKTVVTIKLATKPGVPNVNGVVYSEEEYNKMLEQAQQLINNRLLKLVEYSSVLDLSAIISEDKIYGDVINIKPGEIDVAITNENKLNILKEAINNNYVAGMRYMTDIKKNKDNVREVTNMKILNYDLIKL